MLGLVLGGGPGRGGRFREVGRYMLVLCTFLETLRVRFIAVCLLCACAVCRVPDVLLCARLCDCVRVCRAVAEVRVLFC